MKIKSYRDSHQDAWDDFVKKSRNGTFMQERKFLGYHPPHRFRDCSLMAYDSRDRLAAVIPAASKGSDQKTFCSHPGASHGGIVVGQGFTTGDALLLVSALIEDCRDRGFKTVEIKPVPRVYLNWPCDEIDFALRYNGFSPVRTELATVLPLKEAAPDNPFMTDSARRNIRKAKTMGVTVTESNDYDTYWDILAANLKNRHNARPTHSLAEIKELSGRYPHNIKLVAAYHQDVMIAGVVVFILNSRVINCFYIAHRPEKQHLRPLNLIFDRLINWGGSNGFYYLDWGISTENRGTLVNHGLFRFKEEFGGRGLLRETYALEL
ncbi:hypothetical protein DCCM_2554 [Desulfocucumis palustris]|uniref:BioF2-like acetyltransferase domain-containing protein n=1 Tax=Desulfocucumis palustris TaxID=1898651 RepID=A0A2L2XCL6_9FIRM|nr:GNAT family N-acetyltransferase [Desulfocucumis palustris]GBF33453.1 hypothetical protein DCCM_2554 [Desulfocucumis palustris]